MRRRNLGLLGQLLINTPSKRIAFRAGRWDALGINNFELIAADATVGT